jgi:hypothetical protein
MLLIGVLVAAVWADRLSGHLVASVVALYLLLDALLVNTSYVFVSGSPVSPVPSALLTMGTYLDLALCFAVPWVWLIRDDRRCALWERATTATYESLRTLATVGPESPPQWWVGKLLVVAELLIGIYFVAVVIATYASWARTGRPS